MKLTTLTCPSCGAPVDLDERTISVLCDHCGARVERVPDEAVGMDLGLGALKSGQYEQAVLCFVESLKRNPQDRTAWLCRAIAEVLKPYGSPREGLGYLQESGFTADQAAAVMAPLTSSSSVLFDDCLKHYAQLPAEAAPLAVVLLEGALHSGNPAHQARIAQACLEAADQKWQDGQVDEAVAYMKRALAIDPDKRPQNLWLLDLARQSV